MLPPFVEAIIYGVSLVVWAVIYGAVKAILLSLRAVLSLVWLLVERYRSERK
jgi:hypothetical protein